VLNPLSLGQFCGTAQVIDPPEPDAPADLDIRRAWLDADNANLYATIQVANGSSPPRQHLHVGNTIQTKSNSGSLTNADNFRTNVNLDGRINVGDTNFVKAHAGTAEAVRARRGQY